MVYLKKHDVRDHASTPAFVSTQAVTSTQYCDVELVVTMMSKLMSMAYYHSWCILHPNRRNVELSKMPEFRGETWSNVTEALSSSCHSCFDMLVSSSTLDAIMEALVSGQTSKDV